MRPQVLVPESTEYALQVKHAAKSGWEQWYLLTADAHWDSPECYIKLLHQHLKQAKERDALIIDIGDWFDVINSAGDKRGGNGGKRPEHDTANYLDTLIDRAVEEFSDYADQFLYMGTGNHESKITKLHNTDVTGRFVRELNRVRNQTLPPIHRAGYTGWIRFMFEHNNARCSHSMKIEHGTGGNSPVTKGTIQANRRVSRTEGATLFASGHIHEQWTLNGPVERLNESTSRIEQRLVKHLQVGSYKADFRTDGQATWAMEKMGTPKPIGGIWLRFYNPKKHLICYETVETQVDYPSLTDYLRKSVVKFDRAEVA